MCGVLGLVTRLQLAEPGYERRFSDALKLLRHRGPDGEGVYRDGSVWLGHTRLSILDLSDAGRQPMQSTDGRFAISYNGEVYNFRELAGKHGLTHLRSGSDTEVVLRLFAKSGIASLTQLNGMFAFAVYDKHARKMWLVRDRLGIKPLYYRLDAAGLAFSSEIKGILALTSAPQNCDISSLHEWLYYGNTLGGRTLYQGIQQLLPGHYLEIDLSSFEHIVSEYWSARSPVEVRAGASCDTQAVIGDTRRLLEQAVERQLVSDVPVGLFLSGGVDSSAIAAFASRHYPGRLSTYSVGFDFARDGGELPKAKRVAALYGTEHHEIQINGEDIGDLVEKMVFHHDMPFGDAANIPLYMMAARISAHTKVVLQGDGGDELFGGYRRYATLKYYRLLRAIARAVHGMHGLLPESALNYRIQRYLHAFSAADISSTMARLLTVEDPCSNPSAIFSARLQRVLQQTDPFARYHECQGRFADEDLGNQMSSVDMMIVLPDTYLEKVDRATMAASLEVRVPFLDDDLVDYVRRIPGGVKMPFGKKKWLLKQALAGIVPAEVLYGPKTGLTVPFGAWLRKSLKPLFFDHFGKFNRLRPDVLNSEAVLHLYSQTETGRRDASFMLWKVLNFMIWCNNSRIEIAV